ncbi:MAG: MFS transporter [Anaerolineae bacterium]
MASLTVTSDQPSGKLSFWTKFAYGAGDVGPAIIAGINGFFLLAFLLDVAGLRPGAAGTIFLIIKIWDAVNDPLIGTLSDRTRSRRGRRRPWILFGAVPMGLAFFLHWIVPPLGPAGLFVYYLVVALLLDTAITAVNTPYAALTAELTGDYDERTNLNSFRFSFSIISGVLAVFLHTVILGAFDDVFVGHAVSAAVWALVMIAATLYMVFNVPEASSLEREETGEELGFLQGMKIAFQNRAFVLVTVIYLLSWLAIQFVQANLQLYVRYWLRAEPIFGTLVLAIQLCSFLFVLFWSFISKFIGKKNVYYAGMGFWIVIAVLLFFVQPGQITLVFVLGIAASAGVAVGYLIPWSMLPDVIEMDELTTGQRREGVFYGVFAFLQKTGIALALALSGWVLELAGYVGATPGQPYPVQPEGALLALRVFVGPAAAVVLLLGLVAVYLYPITREKHAEIQAELARRRAAQAGAPTSAAD